MATSSPKGASGERSLTEAEDTATSAPSTGTTGKGKGSGASAGTGSGTTSRAKASMTIEPVISKLEKFILYETQSYMYLVGCDKRQSEYRMLKLDRCVDPPSLVSAPSP